MKWLIIKIKEDEIESKEQFLTFIDVILAHSCVSEWEDKGIIKYLAKRGKA